MCIRSKYIDLYGVLAIFSEIIIINGKNCVYETTKSAPIFGLTLIRAEVFIRANVFVSASISVRVSVFVRACVIVCAPSAQAFHIFPAVQLAGYVQTLVTLHFSQCNSESSPGFDGTKTQCHSKTRCHSQCIEGNSRMDGHS